MKPHILLIAYAIKRTLPVLLVMSMCIMPVLAQRLTSKSLLASPTTGRTVFIKDDCDAYSASNKLSFAPTKLKTGENLKGKWNVQISRFSIEIQRNGERTEDNNKITYGYLANIFPEQKNIIWNLDGDLFKTQNAQEANLLNHSASSSWTLKSEYKDFSLHPIRESRRMWMGIDGSYFDGLYTISITRSDAPVAEIKYYLRAYRQ